MKKVQLIVLAVTAAAGVAYGTLLHLGRQTGESFRFVTVERGDVESVVSATGTLEPVTTVQVGIGVVSVAGHTRLIVHDRGGGGATVATARSLDRPDADSFVSLLCVVDEATRRAVLGP